MTSAKNKNWGYKLRLHIERKFRHRFKHYRKLVKSDIFAKRYALFCLVVLFGITLFWAILGASLQRSNADQIVNPYLFDNWASFHGAVLPEAHTFLLKWPIFFLIHLLDISGFMLGAFTVAISLATVAGLAFLVWRIERRPLYFGTLCLALASVLLLVPPQPYASGILPVNMAMITTRNLEYLLYIGSLYLLARTTGFRSRNFWLASTGLAVLFTSDKLFLTLSVGGALLALAVYYIARRTELARLSFNWLLSSLVGFAGSIGLLWLLSHLVHFSGSGTGPYTLVHNLHDISLGILYGGLGLATNFGANPAFDATIVKNVPSRMAERLLDSSGLVFVINAAVLALGLYIAWRLIEHSFKYKPQQGSQPAISYSFKLSLMLLASSAAAFVAFVLSRHYWAVDARYLTIVVFAMFISAATYLRQQKLMPKKLVLAGGLMSLSVVLGISVVSSTYNADKSALAFINQRNASVAAAIKNHKVDILVGDYWRVLPIKLASDERLKVMPLDSCTHPRSELSSKAWQSDLKGRKFAYLLSLDRSLTDYPTCTLDQVIAAYGRPNTSNLIAGKISNPTELLLFYDNGIRKSSPTKNLPLSPPATVLPISLSQLPNVNCTGRTIMNIVAHQDDDLLFMNPDLLHDLRDGDCIRTVYLTAGDAGSGQFYWNSREQGSEAAYAKMVGFDGVWIKRIVRLGDNQYVRVDNPRGNFKISLIFLRLPDGNVRGQGFNFNHHESLESLASGKIASMHTVDGQSKYSYTQLQSALLALMRTYEPAEIHTQATFVDRRYPDHSDHIAVSRLTRRVWQQYDAKLPINYYIGYPIFGRPANVNGKDLQEKEDAFFAYSKFDESVCSSNAECQKSKASYGAYLPRQYTNNE